MKRFKCRTKRKQKINILIILLIILFMGLFIFISTRKLNNSHYQLVNYLLEKEGFIPSNKRSFLSYFVSNLDVLINNYYFKETKSTKMVYQTKEPLIYLYNTHDNETYQDNYKISEINAIMKKSLDNYGLYTINEPKKVSTYLAKEHLKYSDSYKISRRFLEQAILEYPTLNYFIDLHRDSIDYQTSTIVINNKKYARIMFVLGLDNPSYQENRTLITQLHNYLEKYYPGLSRGIYEKKGSGVNGVYNQDFQKNTMLIELGGVENNQEEIKNSTEILVKGLYDIIGEENEKNN